MEKPKLDKQIKKSRSYPHVQQRTVVARNTKRKRSITTRNSATMKNDTRRSNTRALVVVLVDQC